jgi:hypothetical protein
LQYKAVASGAIFEMMVVEKFRHMANCRKMLFDNRKNEAIIM